MSQNTDQPKLGSSQYQENPYPEDYMKAAKSRLGGHPNYKELDIHWEKFVGPEGVLAKGTAVIDKKYQKAVAAAEGDEAKIALADEKRTKLLGKLYDRVSDKMLEDVLKEEGCSHKEGAGNILRCVLLDERKKSIKSRPVFDAVPVVGIKQIDKSSEPFLAG